jgi:hypothetical protein
MKRTCWILLYAMLAGAHAARAHAVTVQGQLFYEKVPATPHGLDPAHSVWIPLRHISLSLMSADGSTLLDRGITDDEGRYRVQAPDRTVEATLVTYSQCGHFEVKSPTDGEGYTTEGTFELASWPGRLEIADRGPTAGVQNILATLWRADQLLKQVDPSFSPDDIPLTVYWSPTSERTAQQGNEIQLSGRRDSNSDEFDDSVILALYGHLLLQRAVPSISSSGPAYLNERLDPRVAFERAWSIFFAQAVIGSPVYIDTRGPDGKDTIVLDLEPDQLEGDAPGYWSIHSVASALWDIAAEKSPDGTHLALGLGPIWEVLREYFPQQPFPYLITLADGLIQENASWRDGITDVLSRRQIQYQFGASSPVPVPFPRLITSGVPVTGSVESQSTGRTNLLESADYYLVQKESVGPLHLHAILTAAPVTPPGALELVLFDAQGAPIKGTNTLLYGTDSQADLALSLPPGRYVIGVLSYLTDRSMQSILVFASGQYELTAQY